LIQQFLLNCSRDAALQHLNAIRFQGTPHQGPGAIAGASGSSSTTTNFILSSRQQHGTSSKQNAAVGQRLSKKTVEDELREVRRNAMQSPMQHFSAQWRKILVAGVTGAVD
jgi:hypothetical protein